MITLDTLRDLALSFPNTKEIPHFEKASFRVGKKIFATYDHKTNIACIKLSPKDQDVFTYMAESTIYPVGNKWGRQGWTYLEMNKMEEDLFKDALTLAYCEVAPKKLAQLFQSKEDGSSDKFRS